MASLSTARDRYNAANSLLSLLQALEGRITVVELRNEMAVKGLISQVDGFARNIFLFIIMTRRCLIILHLYSFMNVTLLDATVQGNDDRHYNFDTFFVKARNIRYVQIPEDVTTSNLLSTQFMTCIKPYKFQINITEAIKNQIEGKPRAHKTDMSDTTKAKLARKRQRETLKFIQKQQQAQEANKESKDEEAIPSTSQ